MTKSELPLPWAQLRQLMLKRQQLGSALSGRAGVLAVIEQLGYVQIDSVHVVERAHHHVLFDRVRDYQASWLDDLLEQRQIFEYWAHAAAYLPMRDYRFSLYRKHQLQQGQQHWFPADHQQMREVRARIRAEGPLKASDFAAPDGKKGGSWWNWQPAKKALEQLYMQGELMVVRRERFQKVLDLTERVLPAGTDTRLPDEREYGLHLIDQYLHSQLVGTAAQISYLRRGIKPLISQLLQELEHSGVLQSFSWQGQRYYGKADSWQPVRHKKQLWLLNPFDNLLIQRQKLQHWFNFDFQLEIYQPAEKRQFGYYTLALLWGNEFVGLADVKAERASGRLLLQHLRVEPSALKDDDFTAAFVSAVSKYAAFNGCHEVQLNRAEQEVVQWFAQDVRPHLPADTLR